MKFLKFHITLISKSARRTILTFHTFSNCTWTFAQAQKSTQCEMQRRKKEKQNSASEGYISGMESEGRS